MGQGEETKTKSDASVEIQESGDIFFFYRPKVGKEEAHGAEDVQRFYLVLRPHSRPGETRFRQKQDPHSGKEAAAAAAADNEEEEEENINNGNSSEQKGGDGTTRVDIEQQPLLRFIIMGRKSLPDPSKKTTPFWGFVEMVTTKIEHLKAALKGEEYETATKGHRHQASSRAVGEGVYRILRHNNPTGSRSRMHTHLVYKLEYPPEGGEDEPQEALNIVREASFLLQIKNPDQHSGQFGGLETKRKAAFPAHLQGILGHQSYHPADPPDFLNYEGCEFLLISASDDIQHELGLELNTEVEGGPVAGECSDLLKTFAESADSASTRPLLEGTWV